MFHIYDLVQLEDSGSDGEALAARQARQQRQQQQEERLERAKRERAVMMNCLPMVREYLQSQGEATADDEFEVGQLLSWRLRFRGARLISHPCAQWCRQIP